MSISLFPREDVWSWKDAKAAFDDIYKQIKAILKREETNERKRKGNKKPSKANRKRRERPTHIIHFPRADEDDRDRQDIKKDSAARESDGTNKKQTTD